MTGSAWQRLSGLDAYRVTQIPRCPDDDRGTPPAAQDTRRAQRSAVLTAAYHAAVSGAGVACLVALGWVRTAPGSPVHVLVAGCALRGSANRHSPTAQQQPIGQPRTAAPNASPAQQRR